MKNIETVVRELLASHDGHEFDHVDRVRKLALGFTSKEKADKYIVELATLLHDVDDYKLFGEENAKNLTNAKKILIDNHVDDATSCAVLEIIKNMGYSNYLEGARPTTLEGKIVSDADMCDAIGAQGIIRTHAYNLSKGSIFFDKTVAPAGSQKNPSEYRSTKNEHAVQHFFDKLLILPSILLTQSGQGEGRKRQQIMVDFLDELFREEEATEWTNYLHEFTRTLKTQDAER